MQKLKKKTNPFWSPLSAKKALNALVLQHPKTHFSPLLFLFLHFRPFSSGTLRGKTPPSNRGGDLSGFCFFKMKSPGGEQRVAAQEQACGGGSRSFDDTLIQKRWQSLRKEGEKKKKKIGFSLVFWREGREGDLPWPAWSPRLDAVPAACPSLTSLPHHLCP